MFDDEPCFNHFLDNKYICVKMHFEAAEREGVTHHLTTRKVFGNKTHNATPGVPSGSINFQTLNDSDGLFSDRFLTEIEYMNI